MADRWTDDCVPTEREADGKAIEGNLKAVTGDIRVFRPCPCRSAVVTRSGSPQRNIEAHQ
ncbi:hypothetical protein FHS29_006234 [Saccharothrix tamanrassetensis]|uniref:Uncharacterized protein n=1 Tax=Saccharothrix tamanrassetensis TaxID=1051531 RepID=A0A841CRW3_9PSEU|nr:hypothetical protein [Saccharothrix tamanrassetensis]MBB5959613.1 hypothetical protein [Saccharothrix tamanrassetensis]